MLTCASLAIAVKTNRNANSILQVLQTSLREAGNSKEQFFCILSTLKYFNTKKTLHTSALTSADCHLWQLQGFIMLQCQHLSNGNFIYSARSKTLWGREKKQKKRLIPLSTILDLTLPRESNRNILSALENKCSVLISAALNGWR